MTKQPFNLLDLFSGIGGFSLGLERSGGFKTVAFCEIEPFCRKVLKKHWPEVPCYEDITKLTGRALSRDGIKVEAICGGFPCQDISTAGKGAGMAGARSGLWSHYARLIGELRPRYVIVENVAALLGRGLDRVLGDLAEIGYDAEWHLISATDVNAPHLRERIWIVAYPLQEGRLLSTNLAKYIKARGRWAPDYGGECVDPWNRPEIPPPRCVGLANGLPNEMAMCGAFGNAVVPQIPEIIGKAILEAERLRQLPK